MINLELNDERFARLKSRLEAGQLQISDRYVEADYPGGPVGPKVCSMRDENNCYCAIGALMTPMRPDIMAWRHSRGTSIVLWSKTVSNTDYNSQQP